MRRIKHHIVLALCISFVSSGAAGPVEQKPMRFWPFTSASLHETTVSVAKDDDKNSDPMPGKSIKFGPPEPVLAMLNHSPTILRESPDPSSAVIAKVIAGEFEAVEVLEAKPNFVRIRLSTNDDAQADVPHRARSYEGWTTWDAIVSDLTALVLDTETGAVVARVPLTVGLSSVTFSPDGSKAMFFNGSGGIGTVAYEVKTSDYTITRVLSSSEGEEFGNLFYGPADESLYVSAYGSIPRLIRIGTDGGPNTPIDVDPGIKVSPDGRLGFVSHSPNDGEMLVDVFDLTTFALRNTFVLHGIALSSDLSTMVLSKDGSEVFLRLADNMGPVSVIDTRTGQIIRELSNPAREGWSYLSQGDLVADALLLSIWAEGDDETPASVQRFWIGTGKPVLAESGIDFAVQVGDKRFAVNNDGTELFRLDDKNHISERLKIDRPERGTDGDLGNGVSVFSLKASPNGKHIIMFVGIEHGC